MLWLTSIVENCLALRIGGLDTIVVSPTRVECVAHARDPGFALNEPMRGTTVRVLSAYGRFGCAHFFTRLSATIPTEKKRGYRWRFRLLKTMTQT